MVKIMVMVSLNKSLVFSRECYNIMFVRCLPIMIINFKCLVANFVFKNMVDAFPR